MVKQMTAALLIVLVATAACAPRHRMAQTPDPLAPIGSATHRSPDVWRQLAHRIAPGSGIRVLLVDGTRMRAVLLAAEDTSVLVKRRTRIPEPERRIAYADLELLESDTGNGIGAGKAAAIGIGAGAGTFLTLMLIAFALIDN
jgi:hypothetical protein